MTSPFCRRRNRFQEEVTHSLEWQSRTAAPGPSFRTGLDVTTGGTTCLVKMMSFELLQTWGDSGDSELETWLVGPGVAVMTGPDMRLDSLQSGLIAFGLSHPWGTVRSRQRTPPMPRKHVAVLQEDPSSVTSPCAHQAWAHSRAVLGHGADSVAPSNPFILSRK